MKTNATQFMVFLAKLEAVATADCKVIVEAVRDGYNVAASSHMNFKEKVDTFRTIAEELGPESIGVSELSSRDRDDNPYNVGKEDGELGRRSQKTYADEVDAICHTLETAYAVKLPFVSVGQYFNENDAARMLKFLQQSGFDAKFCAHPSMKHGSFKQRAMIGAFCGTITISVDLSNEYDGNETNSTIYDHGAMPRRERLRALQHISYAEDGDEFEQLYRWIDEIGGILEREEGKPKFSDEVNDNQWHNLDDFFVNLRRSITPEEVERLKSICARAGIEFEYVKNGNRCAARVRWAE